MTNTVTVESPRSLKLCYLGQGTLPSSLTNTIGSRLLLYMQNWIFT